MSERLLGALLAVKIAVDDLRIVIFEIQEEGDRIRSHKDEMSRIAVARSQQLVDCIVIVERSAKRLKEALAAEDELP